MPRDLEYPGTADELYLSRNPDVNPYRPLLQGDVLRDIQIAGLDDAGLAIVLTHPCSMRRGPALVPRQLVARVVDAAPFPLTAWATGHMRSMPLPALVPDEPERHFVAQFEEVGAVPSAALVEAERLACLDPRGICLLQQRFVFYLTRFVVPTSDLHGVIAPVLAETELLEEWTEEAARTGMGSDEAAAGFHDFIRAPGEGDAISLQEALEDPPRRGAVRRAVRGEIAVRFPPA